MVALHGTSKISALNILDIGYNPVKTNWVVSDRNFCYGVDYNTLSENYRYYGFQQAFLQGITACLAQNVEILPAVLIINLNDKSYEEDLTNTFDQRFNPIQISNVTRNDILGCYTLEKSFDAFKILLHHNLFDKSSVNYDMPSDILEVCECLENVKFKKDSIRRKTIGIKKYDGIDVPQYITI